MPLSTSIVASWETSMLKPEGRDSLISWLSTNQQPPGLLDSVHGAEIWQRVEWSRGSEENKAAFSFILSFFCFFFLSFFLSSFLYSIHPSYLSFFLLVQHHCCAANHHCSDILGENPDVQNWSLATTKQLQLTLASPRWVNFSHITVASCYILSLDHEHLPSNPSAVEFKKGKEKKTLKHWGGHHCKCTVQAREKVPRLVAPRPAFNFLHSFIE